MRDKILDGEIFYRLKEARVLIEKWRKEYYTIRPHNSVDSRPLVSETIVIPTTQFHQIGLTKRLVQIIGPVNLMKR